MRKEGIPRKVIEAMRAGDKMVLSAAGKAGARAKEKSKENAKIDERLRAGEFAQRERITGAMNEEGDMVHPDDLPQ